MEGIIVRVAIAEDVQYATTITEEMEASARARGTGIAKRSPESIAQKILEGKAVIAVTVHNEWVGFAYIENWGGFVSNSGMIVNPAFRERGVASAIKQRIFRLSRTRYPGAKVFSITTGLAVMKMNTRLGFEPVTFSEITRNPAFWKGCESCPNYDILKSKDFKHCMCTAMMFSPAMEVNDICLESGIAKIVT